MLTTAAESLAKWTTLRLGGPARSFLQVLSRAELYDAVRAADEQSEPVLVLGGGSNLVVADAGFDGTAVHVETRGVQVADRDGARVEVTVEAGESWEALVARAVQGQWVGIEALAGIPGTVGAVPIQNVGAYGQEVSKTITQVHLYDRLERRSRNFTPADCEFGYRSSLFKQNPGRYLVGAVTFGFARGSLGAPVSYAELAAALGVAVGQQVASADVRRAVLDLRVKKGMVLDEADHDTWSAGSFFTNPFVALDVVPAGAPTYPQPDGRVKTSAAWLIDRAGFPKGSGNDRVGVSTKHTLALTNKGEATTADLLALATEIRDGVRATFGIELHPEPSLINCCI